LRERRCLRVITTSLLLKRLSLFRCVKTIYPCSAPPCHTCSSLAKPSLIVQIITKRAKSLLFWSVYSNHDSVVRWHHFKSSSIPNNLMKIILLELSGFAPPRPQVKSSDRNRRSTRRTNCMGKSNVETLTVADPALLNPHDAISEITRTAICGSDLHLYDGFIPTMEAGDAY
jgi:hypothetical protein